MANGNIGYWELQSLSPAARALNDAQNQGVPYSAPESVWLELERARGTSQVGDGPGPSPEERVAALKASNPPDAQGNINTGPRVNVDSGSFGEGLLRSLAFTGAVGGGLSLAGISPFSAAAGAGIPAATTAAEEASMLGGWSGSGPIAPGAAGASPWTDG